MKIPFRGAVSGNEKCSRPTLGNGVRKRVFCSFPSRIFPNTREPAVAHARCLDEKVCRASCFWFLPAFPLLPSRADRKILWPKSGSSYLPSPFALPHSPPASGSNKIPDRKWKISRPTSWSQVKGRRASFLSESFPLIHDYLPSVGVGHWF